jgi:hypothetical protein
MKVLDTESELSFRDVNPEIIEIMEKLDDKYSRILIRKNYEIS